MNVDILHINGGRYAQIETEGAQVHVMLPGDDPAAGALRAQAAEQRRRAERMLLRAGRMEAAAALLDSLDAARGAAR